ncbi:MAG: sphingosine kinase [Gemmatimonadetes bacterium]|nr:sphingosine kinase [Gemmatimonadota bacterium]
MTHPPVLAIVNPTSGSEDPRAVPRRVARALEARGVSARILVVGRDGNLPALARRAAEERAEVVVAAGGDGTVSAMGGAIAGSDSCLAVLPLGTLNHFAGDLGIPLELDDAAAVVAGGRVANVDIGEVNGRPFLNNASLGLYPHIVEERLHQQRVGHAKWSALLWATFKVVLRRHPHLHVRIEAEDREIEAKTQFVFVGNNEYRISGAHLGDRDRLDRGRLSVYLSERSGRLELLELVVRALFGRLASAPAFREFTSTRLVVDTRRHRIRVALDGEVETLEPPLEYRIRPRALRVVVPDGEAD